jgi:oligopeptide/dipeptide ABC transporter ATP-binding protein
MTSLNPVMTVGKQIVEMIRLHLDVTRRQARARAVEMLDAVGIPEARKRVEMYPHEFSGGMRQRAMIAMAIACDPQLIIADEPTTALDVTVQAQVLEVLADVQQRTGAAMILITHDLGVVAGVADRVMVMYAGRLVESAETDPVFYDARHPYTLGLMASLPRIDVDDVVIGSDVDLRSGRRLKPIEGQPPSLLHPPPGCSFHPRCDLADIGGACTEEVPALRRVAIGHTAACHFADDLEARAAAVGTADAIDVVRAAPVVEKPTA